jgi:hypothetical protein
MHSLEQAVFTSVRSRQQEGYQLAATSPGVSAEQAHELAVWGPAHDSLLSSQADATSVNFHPLASGDYCLSKTFAAGEEYSGRGGPRIYTQMLVLSPKVLADFANHPLAILEALTAAGQIGPLAQLPESLPQIPLVGRASAINPLRLAELVRRPGADALAQLVGQATQPEPLAVSSDVPLERLFSGLFMLLPVRLRLSVSFSSGLRWSPRRPFRLIALPADSAEQRAVQRSAGATCLECTRQAVTARTVPSGWAALVREHLRPELVSQLPELLRRAEKLFDPSRSLDDIAELVTSQLHAPALVTN